MHPNTVSAPSGCVRRRAAAAVMLALAVGIASGVSAEEPATHPLGLNVDNPYGRLSGSVITPHMAWARPYARGAVRALVMAPCWSQRETVELAQRMELVYSAWMSASFTSVATPAGPSPEVNFFSAPAQVVYRELDRSLARDYDVIIIGKLDWSMLPMESRFEILRKVSQGTGLIYLDPPTTDRELAIVFGKHPANDAGYILAGVPYLEFPRWRKVTPERLLTLAEFGHGRVVVVRYPKPDKQTWPAGAALTPLWVSVFTWCHGGQAWPAGTEPFVREAPWYDYYLSLVARSALWAAHREPAIRLTDLRAVGPREPSDAGPILRARIQGTSEGRQSVSTELRVMDMNGREVASSEALVRIPTANTVYEAALPPLPAGQYLASVWVREKSGGPVFDWGTAPVSIAAPAQIREIRWSMPLNQAGDPLSGTVNVAGALPGDKLRVELWDNLGRHIATWLGPATGESTFTFPGWAPLVTLHQARAVLVRGGRDLCRTDRDVPVRIPFEPDRFHFVAWGSWDSDPVDHLARQQMYRDGFDALLVQPGYVQWNLFNMLPQGGPNPALSVQEGTRNAVEANLRVVCSFDRYGVFDADAQHRATLRGMLYSVSDPEINRRTGELQKSCAEIAAPYGPLAYSHGDESLFSNDPDVCWAEWSLKKLREYLREQYGNLETLNREWTTNFPNWDAILPVTLAEARKTGRYAPWVDHRRFSQTAFKLFYENTQNYIRKADPGVLTGNDGSGSIHGCNIGMDLEQWSRSLGLLQSYSVITEDLYRSFGPRGSLRGAFFGSYGGDEMDGASNSRYTEFFPWHSIFSRMNSAWFWTMGPSRAMAGGVGGYTPSLDPLPYFRTARDTIREIKGGVDRLLLDSRRENDGIAILYSPVSNIADALMAADPAMQSLAYRYSLTCLSYAIKDAGLQYDFVASAQVEAGYLRTNGFRVLFLPHAWALSPREAEQIRDFTLGGGLVIADVVPGILDDHGKRLPQSSLTDLFPAVKTGVAASVGKGHALLWGNRWVPEKPAELYGNIKVNRWKWAARAPVIRQLAEQLESLAGVRPTIEMSAAGASGHRSPEEIIRFSDGDMLYVGALRDYFLKDEGEYPVTVQFPRVGHLYDVREGTYLGLTDRRPLTLTAHPYLWALSPYRVSGVRLDVPATSHTGETMVVRAHVLADTPSPQRHVFRFEWFGPGGEALPHYVRTVSAVAGKAEVRHQWALNDSPGEYRLTVSDTMSGENANATVKVSE